MYKLVKQTHSPATESELINEYWCDAAADVENIPSGQLGDTALDVSTGDVYAADSSGAWHKL